MRRARHLVFIWLLVEQALFERAVGGREVVPEIHVAALLALLRMARRRGVGFESPG